MIGENACRQLRRRIPGAHRRQGAIIVLAAVFMVFLVLVIALAIDVGYIVNVRTEAQRCADAAALAGGWELLGEDRLRQDYSLVYSRARQKAIDIAALNRVGVTDHPLLQKNLFNYDQDGDILLGRLDTPSNQAEALSFTDPTRYNALQVTVRCTAERNQQSPMFFGRFVGRRFFDMEATATAVFSDSIRGFTAPTNGKNPSLLPFAVNIEDWKSQILDAQGDDQWSFEAGVISSLSDGIPEMRLYPSKMSDNFEDTTGTGNWGTIDIGDDSNSADDIARQILEGPNASDLERYNGRFELDDITGTLDVDGDTGISTKIKDPLAKIKGKPRTLPLYQSLSLNGDNATYTLVGFVGIRILDLKLTGNKRYVLIQPAYVFDSTAISGTGPGDSYFVGQPVHLAR
jgi:hypothetical protein